MVTRVAKAMAEAAGFSWEHCAQSQWERDARAGIEAMREPTQTMIDAGDEICPVARGTESHMMSGGKVPEDYWRAMIVAALSTA